MSCTSLHHIEMCLADMSKSLQLFTSGLGFRESARRETALCSQRVLRQGNSVVVLTQRKHHYPSAGLSQEFSEGREQLFNGSCNDSSEHCNSSSPVRHNKFSKDGLVVCDEERVVGVMNGHVSANTEHFTVFCCRDKPQHTIDSVFNIALSVKDVRNLTAKIAKKGGSVLREPTILSDDHGSITYSIVATNFGNCVHTLIDKSNYRGSFLPGFSNSHIVNGTYHPVSYLFANIIIV